MNIQNVIDGLTILKGCGADFVKISGDEIVTNLKDVRYDDVIRRLHTLGWDFSDQLQSWTFTIKE